MLGEQDARVLGVDHGLHDHAAGAVAGAVVRRRAAAVGSAHLRHGVEQPVPPDVQQRIEHARVAEACAVLAGARAAHRHLPHPEPADQSVQALFRLRVELRALAVLQEDRVRNDHPARHRDTSLDQLAQPVCLAAGARDAMRDGERRDRSRQRLFLMPALPRHQRANRQILHQHEQQAEDQV